MALLERSKVKPPVRPMETVPCAALGGDVIVRGMLLSERLELQALNALMAEPAAGETEQQARARAGAHMTAQMLARCVVLADEKPLYSVHEWDQFGAKQPAAVLDLLKVAQRLSGNDELDIEKN